MDPGGGDSSWRRGRRGWCSREAIDRGAYAHALTPAPVEARLECAVAYLPSPRATVTGGGVEASCWSRS
jgi:hypothetical protein